MLHENIPESPDGADRFDYSEPPPLDRGRWETIRNGVVDELVKGNGKTLKSFSGPAGIEVGRLEIWLRSPDSFSHIGRRLGEKSIAVVIAESLEKHLSDLNAAGKNSRDRCPVRLETSVTRAAISGIQTARSLCELVLIDAVPGLGKTEAINEYISRTTKAEGFGCPVWKIQFDESCISMKAVLSLIAREILGAGRFDEKSEFSMMQAIMEKARERGGVLLVDEGQHLADAQKKMGIPIINLLRSFPDRAILGIAYFGNGEIYRRLASGTGRDKGAYTQIFSRVEEFRLEIFGLGKGGKGCPALSKADVLAVASVWGVSGVEAQAYCLKTAALPGALRTMANICRRALELYGGVDIDALNKVRRL